LFRAYLFKTQKNENSLASYKRMDLYTVVHALFYQSGAKYTGCKTFMKLALSGGYHVEYGVGLVFWMVGFCFKTFLISGCCNFMLVTIRPNALKVYLIQDLFFRIAV